MRTRPDQPFTALVSTLLLGYALASGLIRAARSPRLGAKESPWTFSTPLRKPPPGASQDWLEMIGCVGVAGLITASWIALLVYLVAKLI
jgi:hypothetical protein